MLTGVVTPGSWSGHVDGGSSKDAGKNSRWPELPAMTPARGRLLSPVQWWLVVLVCIDAAIALVLRLPDVFGKHSGNFLDGAANMTALIDILLVPLMLHALWRNLRGQRSEPAKYGVECILSGGTVTTAFQPIRDLGTGAVIGAEALTRFTTFPGRSVGTWFANATSIGRGPDLEFLAMETALAAAAKLPPHLYIAVNLSPAACLDPRLREILQKSGLPPERIVLEVTERSEVTDYEPLAAEFEILRQTGLRVAVDDAGAGFASMRHILQLRPELIKLDRSIIAGIDADAHQRALGFAMVSFARATGATLIAEGIETAGELATVTQLGMNAGQGYFLGQPTICPEDWAAWTHNSTPAWWSAPGPALGPAARDTTGQSSITAIP